MLAPHGHSVATPARTGDSDGEQRSVFDGQLWTYRNGFDEVLRNLPATAWQSPQAQGWQRIKKNARREVWRACLGERHYYLKYYDRSDWAARLKELLRVPACELEWRGGLYALRAGIAAVAPAGFTTSLKRDGKPYALLVTEAEEPAYPLNEFWQQVRSDDDPRRRRHDEAQLIERLGEMIARAHQAGFEHLDMHAANILVQPVAPGRYRTLFVDLHSARLGVPISDRAIVRNLAQLNQWFRRHSSASTRLRFLRAFFRWRNEYEQAFEYGRPLGLSFRGLVRALSRAAARHAERLGAQRDRRAERDGRYFTHLRVAGGWRGMAAVRVKHPTVESFASGVVLEPAWWRQNLADPLRWFEDDQAQSCKDSHSAAVRRALLPHSAGPLPVILKRPLARNWRRRLSQYLPPSRSLRAWRIGHALLNRHVPAARPLAVLQRRFGPLVLDSLLITEAVPGAVDLETYLHRAQTGQPPTAWFRRKRELLERVVRHVRRLEERGFVHRDCKASNILLTPPPSGELLWIDLDGLRRTGRQIPIRRGLRALATLHVSLLDVPGLTRTDRVRFLKSYAARFGTDEGLWRRLWRQLIPLVERRIRKRRAHRLWKLAHYGRE